MARPSTTDDLESWEKAGHNIVVADLNLLSRIPGALAAYAALTDIIRAGADVRAPIAKPHPTIAGTWVVELSGAEMRERIAQKQRSWDRGRDDHETWLRDGTWPTYPAAMTLYCKAEGIEAPTKSVADPAVAVEL